MPNYSPAQVDRAYELVSDGGIQHDGDDRFTAVSSDGTTRYVVDLADETCTCPAGQVARPCYHALAADMVAADLLVNEPDEDTATDRLYELIDSLGDEPDYELDADYSLDRWDDLYV
jgi:uncharacterized Zn finger protein